MKSALFGVLLFLAGCAPAGAQNDPHTEGWRHIRVEAAPVDLDPDHPGESRVGSLIFRGGVELTSQDVEFGGISGLWVGEDLSLMAVSDDGRWIAGRLRLNAQGAPIGLSNVRIAPLRDEHGEMFANKAAGDAEGLARLADGRFAVAYEHIQAVRLYDLDRLGPTGAASMASPLAGINQLDLNAGLEGIAIASDGRMLVGAERGQESASPLWLGPVSGRNAIAQTTTLDQPFGYGLSSLDRLPDGDFISLHRFYAPVVGVRIRIGRIDAENLSHETLLAALAPPLNLDNFEAVSAIPLPNGGARLFVASDNNFSPTQRTLLYVFDLPGSD
ncbi:MAG: esterase-like activity of phytase family protein [Hyphomonadaceae bacterium]